MRKRESNLCGRNEAGNSGKDAIEEGRIVMTIENRKETQMRARRKDEERERKRCEIAREEDECEGGIWKVESL